MLTLYVEGSRWRAHLGEVVAANPGLVPVVKGNGYGLGLDRLAEAATELGTETVATGTYAEVATVAEAFPGAVQVLSPWRPWDASWVAEQVPYGERLTHTVGRVEDLSALADAARTGGRGTEPRVVLELLTSMRRHGFTAGGLRDAATQLDGLAVQGFALHLPIRQGGHLEEVEQLLSVVVASGIPSRRIYASHLTRADLTRLRTAYADFELRPRVGTALWLGDREALQVRATVEDVHEVERGDAYGYRGRTAPRRGHVLVVSGGTTHGVGLEAPSSGATGRARAARLVRGGLEAAGYVRSPFAVDGKRQLFAEPPHMQVSMLFVPSGVTVPQVGEEIDVQVRFTTTSFDRTVLG